MCYYTDEAVCPHCGQVVQGTYEIFAGDSDEGDGATAEDICANCDKQFEIRRNIEITYTTKKMEK